MSDSLSQILRTHPRLSAKSLNHEILVTGIYIYYEVEKCIILTHYPPDYPSVRRSTSRYEATSSDCEIQVTMTYIYDVVNHCITLTLNPKIWHSFMKHYSRYEAKITGH